MITTNRFAEQEPPPPPETAFAKRFTYLVRERLMPLGRRRRQLMRELKRVNREFHGVCD